MAQKKFIVNPNTTLLHDGAEYKGGTVVDLDDEVALKIAPGTLLPATAKEVRAKVDAANKGRVEAAAVRLESLKKEAAQLEADNAAREEAYAKEKELSDMRLSEAQAAVAAAEAEQKKAQGEMDGAAVPVKVPTAKEAKK
jgi:hypothetical protein